MAEISTSVVRKDHAQKMSGRSVYVGDHPGGGVLVGRLLRSRWARARIRGVRVPDLPEGCFYVDARDVPGDNCVAIILDDTPVFCDGTAEYVGDPLGMVCAPDEATADAILAGCEIDAEELEPTLDIRGADRAFFSYEFGHGDVEAAFAEADFIHDEEFETGWQDQVYLETQGMMAVPEEGGRMLVRGSLQCLHYVRRAVARVLGREPEEVRVVQDVTGGAFGGKEAFPSILASQVAVAAHRTGRPVRCVFGRREDLEFTSKRHPSLCRFRAAVRNGRVTALDCDVIFNAGAYSTLSAVVLQRGIIAAPGIYAIPNIHVRGRALRTNITPSGAFRGFGAPQTFFAAEMTMSHIARRLGREPLEFKAAHLVRQGDMTSTQGRYHFPVPVPAMIEEVDALCGFRRRRAEYAHAQTGRHRRGVGISMNFHGGAFTGSGERDVIKSVVRLRKEADGSVEVLASNCELGQGLRTVFPKIVAHELELPLDRVRFEHPDSARVPDSGPTVASRSVMIVGELLRRAAARLREGWIDGEEQEIEERYREPDFMIPFDPETFTGDAYPVFSWAVNAVEVEVDVLTGVPTILGAWGSYDVGAPIDRNIVQGQMEGGLLQGLGYAAMERMNYDARGRIRNISLSDYQVPTAMDVPNLRCILHEEPYPHGPYGAKGAGELPLVGVAAAYAEALEQALGGAPVRRIPFVAEDILKTIPQEEGPHE